MRTIEQEDLFRLRHVTGGRLSPDGTRVAYTVSSIDPVAEVERSEVRILSLDTAALPAGATTRISVDGRSDTQPVWSPDGTRIAYLSRPDGGVPQIHVDAAAGGGSRRLTGFVRGVTGGITWSPDGTRIAFTSIPDEPARDPGRAYRIDRLVYRADGIGDLDEAVRSLYLVEVETGQVTRVTSDRCMHDEPQWSPSGDEILVAASFDPDDAQFSSWPRIVDLATGAIREPTRAWGVAKGACWLADGSGIVFAGRIAPGTYGMKDDLWVLRFGAEPDNRSAGLDVGVVGILLQDIPVGMRSLTPRLDPRGAGAYVRVQRGGRAGLAHVALEGPEKVRLVLDGDRACELLDVGSDRLLFLECDMLRPVDLRVSDLDGGNESRLTALNDEWLASVRLPAAVHRVVFPGAGGVEVEGWFVEPPVVEPSEVEPSEAGRAPHPTVLAIHGGPQAGFGHMFRFETLLLAAAGYGVLLINYRGSSGYGDDFSTAIVGDVGTLEFEDLMAGVDRVVELGWADPDRLGVYGASYGGMMTCWIVGHTARFAGAVSQSPLTNRSSYYGTGDIGTTYSVDQLGARPWEAPALYDRGSPISYAHLATTPTLLISNEDDWRCPSEQAEQFFVRLKVVGCETEMVRIPNASHSGTIFGPVAGRIARNEALVGWLDRHVLGPDKAGPAESPQADSPQA